MKDILTALVSYIESNNSRLFSHKWALKENRKTPSISCITVVEGYYRLTVRFLMYEFMKIEPPFIIDMLFSRNLL